MAKKIYRHIYGPVSSWRLGRSLGIDPISARGKVCSFDCIYCQAGKTSMLSGKRKEFVPAEKIIEEIKSLPSLNVDYITFSGLGEPTLAKNLGKIIKAVKRITDKKVAVLTNSSLIYRKDVQRDLLQADFVIAKIDAPSQKLFAKINRPLKSAKLEKLIAGIKEFKSRYRGRFALQIMFTEENKSSAEEIAGVAKDIAPDEVQINTPLRPSGTKPLSKRQLNDIAAYFKALNFISVYDIKRKNVMPISKKDTLRRRGKL